VLALSGLDNAVLKLLQATKIGAVPIPPCKEPMNGSAASNPPRDGSVTRRKERPGPADNFETQAASPRPETLPANHGLWGPVEVQDSDTLAAARGSEEQAGSHGSEERARSENSAARTGFADRPKTSRC